MLQEKNEGKRSPHSEPRCSERACRPAKWSRKKVSRGESSFDPRRREDGYLMGKKEKTCLFKGKWIPGHFRGPSIAIRRDAEGTLSR